MPHPFTSWRTSSYTHPDESCVEAGRSTTTIGVRDTKAHGTGPTLELARPTWAALLAGLRAQR